MYYPCGNTECPSDCPYRVALGEPDIICCVDCPHLDACRKTDVHDDTNDNAIPCAHILELDNVALLMILSKLKGGSKNG